MGSWREFRTGFERWVLRRPVLAVAALLLLATVVAGALPGGTPNLGATIWLVASGVVLVWRHGVLRDKYPAEPRPPGLLATVRGWWAPGPPGRRDGRPQDGRDAPGPRPGGDAGEAGRNGDDDPGMR